MDGRILFFLGSVFLLSGCKESKQPEGYNSVSLIEYINTYDANNRIIAAQGTEYDYIYFGENKDKEVLGGTEYRTKKYSYLNDSCYTVEEPLSESLTQIMRYTGKTAEELVLENGKDTMHYSFDRYYDRDKPEYEKRVTIFKDEPAADSRYENYYYYDGSGNNTKIVHHDLNTGQREETYKFDGIDYKEAISLVPSSDCKQNIECNFTQIVNDTSITRTTFNGVLSRVVKEYIDGEKKLRKSLKRR